MTIKQPNHIHLSQDWYVVTYSIRGYHWSAYTCLFFHVRRRCWCMSFFSRWPVQVKMRNTRMPAAFRRPFFLSGSMAKNAAQVSHSMSWPSADPCLGSAFCLCLLPWVRCSAWPRCGRWPLDLSHTSAFWSTSPRAVGEQGNEEDAFPKNSFSSRVMVRGRGLKEEVRGLREPPLQTAQIPVTQTLKRILQQQASGSEWFTVSVRKESFGIRLHRSLLQ